MEWRSRHPNSADIQQARWGWINYITNQLERGGGEKERERERDALKCAVQLASPKSFAWHLLNISLKKTEPALRLQGPLPRQPPAGPRNQGAQTENSLVVASDPLGSSVQTWWPAADLGFLIHGVPTALWIHSLEMPVISFFLFLFFSFTFNVAAHLGVSEKSCWFWWCGISHGLDYHCEDVQSNCMEDKDLDSSYGLAKKIWDMAISVHVTV